MHVFPVTGKCARSQLMSVRDCQAITKKGHCGAVCVMHGVWTGCRRPGVTYPLDVSSARRCCANHAGRLRRGAEPPWLSHMERRSAACVRRWQPPYWRFHPWRPGLALHDPCCGTGTLLIEAAFKQARRAPGLFRPFAMEQFSILLARGSGHASRASAKAQYDPERIHDLSGSDIAAGAVDAGKAAHCTGAARRSDHGHTAAA